MDGGLERLVRLLHDFCISPPPPENPAILYGLLPVHHHPPQPQPTLNPKSFDRHAAYRFSLAFQCVVNIGVRGSEPIRSRVVQAGTLDVVGCVLEAWLASKGFATGPSSSASGLPRETREQRSARRAAQNELRNREQAREQAADLARALERQQLERQQLATRRRIARPDEVSHISLFFWRVLFLAFQSRYILPTRVLVRSLSSAGAIACPIRVPALPCVRHKPKPIDFGRGIAGLL